MKTKTPPSTDASAAARNLAGNGFGKAQPFLSQPRREIQAFGTIARLPNGLDEEVCRANAEGLNQILADTLTIRDQYKKHHWQVAGPTFYQLHLLFDKHYQEQAELVDELAERVQV